MMLSNLLNRAFKSMISGNKKRQARRNVFLRLEQLEDRAVPSTVQPIYGNGAQSQPIPPYISWQPPNPIPRLNIESPISYTGSHNTTADYNSGGISGWVDLLPVTDVTMDAADLSAIENTQVINPGTRLPVAVTPIPTPVPFGYPIPNTQIIVDNTPLADNTFQIQGFNAQGWTPATPNKIVNRVPAFGAEIGVTLNFTGTLPPNTTLRWVQVKELAWNTAIGPIDKIELDNNQDETAADGIRPTIFYDSLYGSANSSGFYDSPGSTVRNFGAYPQLEFYHAYLVAQTLVPNPASGGIPTYVDMIYSSGFSWGWRSWPNGGPLQAANVFLWTKPGVSVTFDPNTGDVWLGDAPGVVAYTVPIPFVDTNPSANPLIDGVGGATYGDSNWIGDDEELSYATYTPHTPFAGSDSFSYMMDDAYGNSATAEIFINVDPVSQFSISGPSTATAGTPFAYTVTAEDYNNTTVPGYGGTVAFGSSDGGSTIPSASTLVSGVGVFTATLTTSGSQTVGAIDPNAYDSIGDFPYGNLSITVLPASPTHFILTNAGSPSTGTAFAITITALDSFNNVATGYNSAAIFTSSGTATVSMPSSLALVSGAGVFSATLSTTGTRTITASAGTVTGSCDALPATHFAVSSPAYFVTDMGYPVTVTAEDTNNNVATGYAGTLAFSSSDTGAFLPAESGLTNGTGVFTAALQTTGSKTLTVEDAANTTTAGSASVTVENLHTLYLTGGSSTVTAGDTLIETATAYDAYGNVAVTFNGSAGVLSSDGGAILPGSASFVSGVAIFSVTLTTAGTQSITVNDSADAKSVTASSITVNVGTLTQFTFTGVPTDDSGGVTEWVEFDVTAYAADAWGNVVTSFSGDVTYSSNDSWATFYLYGGYATFSSGSLNIALAFSSGGAKDNGGTCTFTLTSNDDSSITGSFTVTVNPPGGG